MSADALRAQILQLVAEFAAQQWQPEPFEPGVTPVPVSGKVFDGSDVQHLVDASLDFWLTTGRFAREFERSFADETLPIGEFRIQRQPARRLGPHFAPAGRPAHEARG